MQAYANIGSIPAKKLSKAGKTYFEFRAAESAKGDEKEPTWYTVRIFKDEIGQLDKGDFVVFTGKLKQDVFVGRDGKPMGVLVVMAFQLAKVSKEGTRQELVAPAATTHIAAPCAATPKAPVAGTPAANAQVPAPTAPATPAASPASESKVDEASEASFIDLMN